MRQTYLESGPDCFHDHELLELLLTYAIVRRDTNGSAHRLLDTFGSLEKVLEANPYDLKKVEGIGEYSAILLALVGDIHRRAQRRDLVKGRTTVLNAPEDATRFCRMLLLGEKYEGTYAVSLDGRRRVIHADRVGSGTINETVVYTRLVVECALRHGASSIILTHNHPSGNPMPSREDVLTTQSVSEALSSINITLHDHIIVSKESAYSMTRAAILAYGETEKKQVRAAEGSAPLPADLSDGGDDK